MVNGVAVQPESRRGVQELRLEECTKREELRCRAERQELMSGTSDTGTVWGQVEHLGASRMQQSVCRLPREANENRDKNQG